ncbi:hypothetical protein N9B94_04440 [Verrucomicrobia bacterium]|nr:hypothetical protein [Verrucomicrobiota bacterium]
MKRLRSLLFTIAILMGASPMRSALADSYHPELFKSLELIYDEGFEEDGPHKVGKHWVIRQETQWNVKDGVLVGEVATEEFQKKIQATGDGHDGTRAVIFLKPVPKAFVVRMRLRYDETPRKGRDRGSLLDLGHHVNSFIFGKEKATLTLQKKKKIVFDGEFFPLNQWNDVTIEIKEGVILIKINDRKEIIRNKLVTLKSDSEFQQIDFKGQDFGKVRIDWVKLYKGIE